MEAVKITQDNYGEKRKDAKWHLGIEMAATDRTLCEGEAYGDGDSSAVYTVGELKKGKITCPSCISLIKKFKQITL